MALSHRASRSLWRSTTNNPVTISSFLSTRRTFTEMSSEAGCADVSVGNDGIAAPESSTSNPAPKPSRQLNLVMQIILPKSLVNDHSWPVGPLMAQSAHAATAVLHLHADTPEVKDYLNDLEGMRKTVMEVPDEAALRSLAEKLDSLVPRIPYHLWIEQPENIATALALVPNRRPKALKSLLDQSGCKLWK